MASEELIAQLTQICQNLGAEKEQAQVMARQLKKRSEQLARERTISEIEALHYLLDLVKRGRDGDTVPEFPSEKG